MSELGTLSNCMMDSDPAAAWRFTFSGDAARCGNACRAADNAGRAAPALHRDSAAANFRTEVTKPAAQPCERTRPPFVSPGTGAACVSPAQPNSDARLQLSG